MTINELMSLLGENKFYIKESHAPIRKPLKSKVVKEQIVLILPLICQVLHVYEFDGAEDLTQEKRRLLKNFKKEYFDGEVVAIEFSNLYIVTSKNVDEEESKLEKQLKDIFLS